MSPSQSPKTEPATKAPRTASKEVRRQQLIDATIDGIAKHGISGTTMGIISGNAGMSAGFVNFHFASKEDLFDETLRYLAEEHRDQWKRSYERADLAPKSKLLAIVDAHYHPRICNRKKLAVWFAFYGEARNRAKYRNIMQEIDPERWKLSIALCSDIIAEGDYAGIDPESVADTLEGLYDGFCLNILMYPGEFSRDDARRQIRIYLATTFPKHFDIPAPKE